MHGKILSDAEIEECLKAFRGECLTDRMIATIDHYRALAADNEKAAEKLAWERNDFENSLDNARVEFAQKERDLRDRAERLEREMEELHETIAAFQDASGLLVGGDPGGVTPKHVSDEIQRLERENARLRKFVEFVAAGKWAEGANPGSATWLDSTLIHFAKEALAPPSAEPSGAAASKPESGGEPGGGREDRTT